jgi:hypothetical protein
MAFEHYEIELPPPIFARGFWLYAWFICAAHDSKFCYIGMTGDRSGKAQSPFWRAGSHFGDNKQSNQIRRLLDKRGLIPEKCASLKMIACGPLFPYQHSEVQDPEFHVSRRKVEAAEKALWNAFRNAGYEMLNGEPRCASSCEDQLWQEVKSTFRPFLDLKRE